MGKPSVAHLRMREVLTENGFRFAEEVLVAGHKIDFVVADAGRRLGVDVNGDRWHRWPKIVESDRVKLDRVFAPEQPMSVLGVWWSRLQRHPESVVAAILFGLDTNRLAWWDWAVPFDQMTQSSGMRAESLVLPPSETVSRLT